MKRQERPSVQRIKGGVFCGHGPPGLLIAEAAAFQCTTRIPSAVNNVWLGTVAVRGIQLFN
eukprot:NODE_3207_length_376_cov_199089.314985_g3125_i0.p2 GENE.NODE_3207_length_376_cov_199089.314985_g3125_i0~~NODE_3207_length_376_cov_199089.314985_g3125_i0.p2  ORF type:complete len:61 (-),score=1.95 NODE_3207_length_376_cov_199089.314985_g3125_i0:77-259(-)